MDKGKPIGIIDYKAGNAPSVLNALCRLDVNAKLIFTPEQIAEVSSLILPGVGAARATMDSLGEMGFIEALNDSVLNGGVPFLGICVGMQVLFEHSEEGDTPCLGWLRGRVLKFPDSVRVPQMGWNKVDFKLDDPLTIGANGSGYFYFVNSYFVKPDDKKIVLGTTDYGGEFCSMIRYKNIAASQFHLEKSGAAGLKLLKNFAFAAAEGRGI